MGLFSVPAVLGMPSGFYVAGTEIYRLLNNFPPRVSQAAAWGLLLLVVTAASGLGSERAAQPALLRDRDRQGVPAAHPGDRPAFAMLLAAIAWLYVATAVVLPVATLIWAALVNFITIDPKLMAFDLAHFRYVLFEYPEDLSRAAEQPGPGRAPPRPAPARSAWAIELGHRAHAEPARGRISTRSACSRWRCRRWCWRSACSGSTSRMPMLPIYGTIWILLHRLCDALPAVRRARGLGRLAAAPSRARGCRAHDRRQLGQDDALDHLPADPADAGRGLDPAVHPVDAGDQLLDPALHQPHHRAVGRGVRSLGGRQRQCAGGAQRDPARHHLRRARGASFRARHREVLA